MRACPGPTHVRPYQRVVSLCAVMLLGCGLHQLDSLTT